MSSKSKLTANPRLVVWLPTIFFIAAAVNFRLLSDIKWFWFGLATLLSLTVGVIVTGIISLRRHEYLRQSAWQHILNMLWVALAILGLLIELALIVLALSWPSD